MKLIFVPWCDETALEQAFNDNEISSVIIEGIQGVGGIQVAAESFLQKIRALCDAHNAVFIADSVQCGYGRTGKFFSHDFAGIDADIYTMAKGMGNGFPVGGIIISPKIQPAYGMLGTTFGGNHLACAAGLAVLEVMEENNLMQNAADVGDYLISELKKFKQVKEVRGRGLMIGIELPAEFAHVRKELLFTHHIFTGEAKPNVVRLLPALNLTKAHADRFLEAFTTVVNQGLR
jgi:acetylornithine aminotransferase